MVDTVRQLREKKLEDLKGRMKKKSIGRIYNSKVPSRKNCKKT